MIKLYEGGTWLLNGTELIADGPEAAAAVEHKTGKKQTDRKQQETPLLILF